MHFARASTALAAALIGNCSGAVLAQETYFRVRCFAGARGGDFSPISGNQVVAFVDSLYDSFIRTQIVGTDSIGSGDSGAQLAIYSTVRTATNAITPLTAIEQVNLRNFVLSGHGALLFVDNHNFAGAGTDAVNESLIDAFGIDVTGRGMDAANPANVANPQLTPVTDGPFGTVTDFRVASSGWLDVLPAEAQSVARLSQNANTALAVIPRDALAPGSGPVIVFSDSSMLTNSLYAAFNTTVVRNAVAYAACLRPLNRLPTLRACGGATYSITFNADGATPIAYQWTADGVPLTDGPTATGSVISGATTPTLTISGITSDDGRRAYSCVASNHCSSFRSDERMIQVVSTGDLNCDCFVNNFDIDPFVLAVSDAAGYSAAFPGCDRTHADINGDGSVDNFDIDGFVDMLGS